MILRRLLIVAFCLSMSLPMAAQQRTEAEYATRYSLLNGRVGAAGLGMETLIANWEKDYPDSKEMLCAKFAFNYIKSQSSQIVRKDQAKFMGSNPVVSLPDTLTGKNVNYFEEVIFDDALFGIAEQALDKAIKLYPLDLMLRLSRVSSLISYEKESPDMAKAYLSSLIDYNITDSPKWIYEEKEVSGDEFLDLIQEYCFVFFKIASPVAMETFLSLSTKLSSAYPKKAVFYSNIGSYYFVFKGDTKTALKYYNKALKVDPDEYSAIKNGVLLARKTKDTRLEKKFLVMLERVSEDATEKVSAKARLESLK